MSSDASKQRVVVVAVVSAAAAAATVFYVLHRKGYTAKLGIFGRRHASSSTGEAAGSSIRPVTSIVKKGYTREQLAQYDGVKNERIFMSVKMKVYEVAPHFYGPGQHYHIFAGTEASLALARADLTGKYLNQYWVNCSEEELEVLEEYVEKFNSKYPIVGWYVPDEAFYVVTE
ncbi:Cytochrome b5-like Heme/Steroid binding domain containing protein [Novymonas esmeraldas]|uniref:Cytochrome b5-like Heme/Steroid binding domain containing protein n=1 Tax=Novymonas esmeraldas TaxID=1808958 RepID=A0AAW0ERY2_9TRYP